MVGSVMLIFLYSSFIVLVEAEIFKLDLTFQSYQNPSNGSVANRECCDRGFVSQFCYLPCETMFRICIRQRGTDSTDDSCPFPNLIHYSGVIASDNILFSDSVGTLTNPVVFTANTLLQNGMQIYIKVEDDDLGGFDDDLGNMIDLIDKFFVEIPSTVGSIGDIQMYDGINGLAYLNMGYKLQCAMDNYYGQNCDVFCIPQNDSTNGHYTCNQMTGAKECLPEYQDPNTNCLSPLQSTINTHPVRSNVVSTSSISLSELKATASIYPSSEKNFPVTKVTLVTTTISSYPSSIGTKPFSTVDSVIHTRSLDTPDLPTMQAGSSLDQNLNSHHFSTLQPVRISSSTAIVETSLPLMEGKGDAQFNIIGIVIGVVAVVVFLILITIAGVLLILILKRKHFKTIAASDNILDTVNGHYYSKADDLDIKTVSNPNYEERAHNKMYMLLEHNQTTSQNFYMALRDPHIYESTDLMRPRGKGSVGSICSYEVMRGSSRPQEYSSLYETPVDGAIPKGVDRFVDMKVAATSSSEYYQPLDGILHNSPQK